MNTRNQEMIKCHEPTDTPSKITPSEIDKSDPERTSLHGIPTESNLETYLKCRKSKALVEIERNRSNQLNPNHDAYYQSRGYDDKDDYADKYGF